MSIIALLLAFIAGFVAAFVAVAVYNIVADLRAQARWDAIVDEWRHRHEISQDGMCLALGCGYDEYASRVPVAASAMLPPVAATLVANPTYYWDAYDEGYETAVNDIFERDLTTALDRNGYDADGLSYPPMSFAEMDCAS